MSAHIQDMSKPSALALTGTFAAPQPASARAPLAALPVTQTSSLERYLAQIADPALRESLEREIAGAGRTFGLVFERHHPEGIRLPQLRSGKEDLICLDPKGELGTRDRGVLSPKGFAAWCLQVALNSAGRKTGS